jgi:protein-tyrosine-phosphatase/DNA-binding transcriptional ArsR family regulator
MLLDERAQVHWALGDGARLALVDLLSESDLTVSELGSAVSLPGNLLAHHLNVLEGAGLIQRRVSEGDGRRRYVTLNRAKLAALARSTARPAAVFFVCSHNSARSQYAAAYWTKRTGQPAGSAGSDPSPTVNPLAVRVASERGIDLRDATPRGYDTVTALPDLLISVCDQAREGDLPAARRHAHWSIPDPVAAGRVSAFRSAFNEIERRVDALAS